METYDQRLDTAILRPIEDPQMQTDFQRKLAEWDPTSSRPQPLPEFDYDYYVPTSAPAVRSLKRKFDVNDPENTDPDLYTDDLSGEGARGFKYERVRTYETYNQHGNPNNYYNDSVALALHDPESDVGLANQRLGKAAYYYPIIQRTALRPKRKVGRMALSQGADEDRIDGLHLTIGELAEEDRARLAERRAELDPSSRPDAVQAAAG